VPFRITNVELITPAAVVVVGTIEKFFRTVLRKYTGINGEVGEARVFVPDAVAVPNTIPGYSSRVRS
jgi:hypothetical protein